MKAVAIEEFGGTDRLKTLDLPVPIPAPTEVLIEITYAAVNPVDWMIREGGLKNMFPHRFPIVLGWDAAGVVEARGVNVTRFHVGDRVYAYCRKGQEVHDGTYAEYISIDERRVARMPRRLNFREAAAVPLAGLTAWQALFDAADFRQGETILVQGGAGGVGSFAIQFARAKKAGLILTTARAEHHPYLMSIGTDVAIDYTRENVADALHRQLHDGVDVVLDLVGGDTLAESFSLIRPGGRLVTTIGRPDSDLAAEHDVTALSVTVEGNGGQLEEIGALIDQGIVQPPRIEEFDLEHVASALEKSRGHHVEGKLVLRVK